MIQVWHALLTAEAIKLRRSAPVIIAAAAPALLFILELATLFSRIYITPRPPIELWRDFLNFAWVLWLGVITPALVTSHAISLAGVEHAGRHWKQLLTLPFPRWQVYAVKMLTGGALLAASYIAFVTTSVLAVVIFSATRDLNLASHIPWAEILTTALRAYVAAWPLIVIHTWISVRFPGFPASAGVCFSGLLVGVMLMILSRDFFGFWYPWLLPLNARRLGRWDTNNPLIPAIFGAVGGVVLAAMASLDLGKRAPDS
jgi:hypothetical protein